MNTLADVNYYVRGGGQRTFTGFNTNTQTYAFQQLDQTFLTRTGPASYEMLSRDGSKLVFSQSDGSSGSARNIFLTQVVAPYGNAVALTYDVHLRLVAVALRQSQLATQEEICRAFGHDVSTQARWERQYRHYGIDGLVSKKRCWS